MHYSSGDANFPNRCFNLCQVARSICRPKLSQVGLGVASEKLKRESQSRPDRNIPTEKRFWIETSEINKIWHRYPALVTTDKDALWVLVALSAHSRAWTSDHQPFTPFHPFTVCNFIQLWNLLNVYVYLRPWESNITNQAWKLNPRPSCSQQLLKTNIMYYVSPHSSPSVLDSQCRAELNVL